MQLAKIWCQYRKASGHQKDQQNFKWQISSICQHKEMRISSILYTITHFCVLWIPRLEICGPRRWQHWCDPEGYFSLSFIRFQRTRKMDHPFEWHWRSWEISLWLLDSSRSSWSCCPLSSVIQGEKVSPDPMQAESEDGGENKNEIEICRSKSESSAQNVSLCEIHIWLQLYVVLSWFTYSHNWWYRRIFLTSLDKIRYCSHLLCISINCFVHLSPTKSPSYSAIFDHEFYLVFGNFIMTLPESF